MKKQITKLLLVLSLIAPVAFTPGCKTGQYTVAEGADPIVVRAEQTLAVTFHTIDAFVKWEYANRKVAGPKITAIADDIRRSAPQAFEAARQLLSSYKSSRSPSNKEALQKGLEPILKMSVQAQTYK